MILIGIVITSVLYWATTNVCRYNFVIEKKTNEMNIKLSWDYERVLSNLNTISVMIYQELTTDIKGNPN